jgi:hypothetical protein
MRIIVYEDILDTSEANIKISRKDAKETTRG